MREKAVLYLRILATFALLIVFSFVMLGFTVLTLGLLLRKNFVWILTPCARLILRVWGLRLEVVPSLPVPDRQTVFIFNHPSTIDVFALSAMGLPDTRFFMSGFLRKNPMFAVLGYLTGIFWTVRQDFPEQRARIFQAACETLKRTGQSVALSPEGMRVATGEVGAFNKGAFHLAAALAAPIRPLFIDIPPESNPGLSWHVRPGVVKIRVGDLIDTSDWKPEDAGQIKEEIHELYVAWNRQIQTPAPAREDHA